ncbi:Transposase IS116/IS110/IS902 family protein [Clostridium ljungdahlii]|uniref:Transposase IS116/IS110/IS902 family protein n=1 Tax=Clostridium ljungdahlii TaxID=1538 RepID=A0A170NKX0_9CLOT|nr:transposase [Clostridium ljungdahlii]OAA91297.1 Transposase IS116/IS110/IS902 family protein [Clostridium ljungdahlii]
MLDQIFPEYNKLFSDIWGVSSKAVLEKCQTPEGVLELDINDLTELLKTKSKGRLGFNKAEEIQNAAKNTFGIKIAKKVFKFQIEQLISQVLFLEKQMKSLDSEIEFYYSQFDCHLTTIPGIGPTVKQSGQFLSNKNKMSKRGSPYLRRALFLSASTCVLHDSPLNEYYNKKRSEGKHHLVAVGATSNKLTRIVFAVMRDNKDYVPIS